MTAECHSIISPLRERNSQTPEVEGARPVIFSADELRGTVAGIRDQVFEYAGSIVEGWHVFLDDGRFNSLWGRYSEAIAGRIILPDFQIADLRLRVTTLVLISAILFAAYTPLIGNVSAQTGCTENGEFYADGTSWTDIWNQSVTCRNGMTVVHVNIDGDQARAPAPTATSIPSVGEAINEHIEGDPNLSFFAMLYRFFFVYGPTQTEAESKNIACQIGQCNKGEVEVTFDQYPAYSKVRTIVGNEERPAGGWLSPGPGNVVEIKTGGDGSDSADDCLGQGWVLLGSVCTEGVAARYTKREENSSCVRKRCKDSGRIDTRTGVKIWTWGGK